MDNITIIVEDFTQDVNVQVVEGGIKGETGNGISSVVRTSGDGSQGTTDTYTITYTDATTTTFNVLNGADGVVQSIVAGDHITIDNTDPTNPIANVLVNGLVASGNVDAVSGGKIYDVTRYKADLEVGKNLYNKNSIDIIDGYYMHNITGSLVLSPTRLVTEYIPVSAGDYAISVLARFATFFDINYNVISNPLGDVGSFAGPITIPANVVYIRLSIDSVRTDIFQIERGSISTSYEDYKAIIPNTQIVLPHGLVVNGDADFVDGSTVYNYYKNLVNTSNFTQLLFPSKREQINSFYNSSEDGFPQIIFGNIGGIQSVITTPSDCPFDVDVLPQIYQYVGGGSGDFKFEFPYNYINKGEVTFSFWTKKSQFDANGTNTINILKTIGGVEWIPFLLPDLVGGETSIAIHGITTLKWVYTYGDWIQLQLQFTDFQDATFSIRFAVSSTNTMYFANVIALKSLEDVSPFLVRYKLKNSAVESRLQFLEGQSGIVKDVVCYGDSLTAGSYPSKLQTLLGNDYTVYNRGVGGEGSLAIVGRVGGSPFYIENVTIPATTTPVILGNLASGSGIKSLFDDANKTPLLQHTANAGINPCYVEGIECELKWTGATYSDPAGNWTIERLTAGDAKTTRAKSLISTYNMAQFKDAHASIFMIGANGDWTGEAEYLQQTSKMLSVIKDRRFIVITSHASNSTALLIEEMTKEYGLEYIDLRTYMNTYAIYDAMEKGYLVDNGTYPTTADSDAMALGNCPPSLLADSIHFNDVGYDLFADLIRQKMIELGF